MQRMEVVELTEHPFFVAVQYHPEYLSRDRFKKTPFRPKKFFG
jgi:CTP synthase